MQDKTGNAGQGPRGIAGWLYLVAAVIAVAPLFIGWRALRNAQSAAAILGGDEMLSTGLWILLEFVATAIVLAASLYVAYLFFRKKKSLPRAYVWFIVAALIASAISFITGAVLLAAEVDSDALAFDLVNWRAPIAGVIWALISIPYMLRSQRVRNTFTEG